LIQAGDWSSSCAPEEQYERLVQCAHCPNLEDSRSHSGYEEREVEEECSFGESSILKCHMICLTIHHLLLHHFGAACCPCYRGNKLLLCPFALLNRSLQPCTSPAMLQCPTFQTLWRLGAAATALYDGCQQPPSPIPLSHWTPKEIPPYTHL
jgi:hypothetical protein